MAMTCKQATSISPKEVEDPVETVTPIHPGLIKDSSDDRSHSDLNSAVIAEDCNLDEEEIGDDQIYDKVFSSIETLVSDYEDDPDYIEDDDIDVDVVDS